MKGGIEMTASNRILLHRAIDNLSDKEVSALLKIINDVSFYKDIEIEKVSDDDPDLPMYIKTLDEMDKGEYISL
jgi:hypothetical protein